MRTKKDTQLLAQASVHGDRCRTVGKILWLDLAHVESEAPNRPPSGAL